MDNARRSLIIGVNGYKPTIGKLRFCVSDANRIESVLKTRREGFTSTESILLSDDQDSAYIPNRINIIENVLSICNNAKTDDTLIVYFSGHGGIGNDAKLYLLPIDASTISLEQSCVSWEWIKEQIEKSQAKNKIFIIDACHSGAGRDIDSATRISSKLMDEIEHSTNGFVCIAACSGGQLSYELSDLGQGIFSYYLVNGISGEADPLGKGIIDIENLYNYARQGTIHHAGLIGVKQEPYLIAKASAPLNTFTISSAPLDSPINQVLIVTKDPLLGRLLETGISMSRLVRSAVWINDLKAITDSVKTKFNYDAVYVDVGIGDGWDKVRDFIAEVRRQYPVVPFVLVGTRDIFLQNLTQKEREKFRHYFFFEVGIPLSRAYTLIQDTLGQVVWDIQVRYGEMTIK